MVVKCPFKAFLVIIALIILNGFNSVVAQAPIITYPTPKVYTQNSAITPLSPTNKGGLVPPNGYGQVTMLAGSGTPGLADGVGNTASFYQPYGIAIDGNGTLFVADDINNAIRKITPGGVVTTMSLTGPAFNGLKSIAIDKGGNLYTADAGNNEIKKISPSGLVTIIAGNLSTGSADGNGATASFNMPNGVALDGSGNIYVADYGNHIIRKITPAGIVTTLAGNGQPGSTDGAGPVASFRYPTGVAVDVTGNVYVADGGNGLIRKITSNGNVTTFAGNTNGNGVTDGLGTAASFGDPIGIVVNTAGYIFVADGLTNTIRKISPAGLVSTIAGGTKGSADGIGTSADFYGPNGVTIDFKGNIYVSDSFNNLIRKVSITGYTIDKPLPAGLTFDLTTGNVSGTPTVTSPATDYTITAYNSTGSSSFTVSITVNSTTPTVLPPKISYTTPNTYPANSPITPLVPNTGAGGAVPNTFLGLTEAFTGTGNFGKTDGGPIASSFHFPLGVATDGGGNFYVADYGNNLIRKVNSAGDVTTFAGTGNQGNTNGVGTGASFNSPSGIAVDAAGNVYVADAGNNTIRKITPTGVVTSLAGNNVPGAADGTGTAATFNNPLGVAVDAAGNVYVADAGNSDIRKITPAGVVTTFAGTGVAGKLNGTGTAASFSAPVGLAFDAAGNLYIADTGNNLIRMITPAGVVSTVAGDGIKGNTNGPALNSAFNKPSGITVDLAGNIFISDSGNNLIRMLTPQGQVITLAGSGLAGGFNNVGILAQFAYPVGLTIDAAGNLYIADKFNNQIRKVVTTGYFIDKPLPAGLVFDSSTGIISGIPTAATPATTYTITAYNEGGNNSTQVTITITAGAVTVAPPAITYQTPQTYTVSKTITPLSPTNNGGPVPATIYGQISSLAGSGVPGKANGTGIASTFNQPAGLAIDAGGNVYVADVSNLLIRKITPAGVVTTIPNYSGGAFGLAVDAAGTIYIADEGGNQIEKISPFGIFTVIAGSTTQGNTNGAGTAASFNTPIGIAVDASGNLYVADELNNLIRKITPAGVVTTFAGSGAQAETDGTGTSAAFNRPIGIAVDANGNVFVADYGGNKIRKISPAGVVTTLAGSGTKGTADGTGTQASFFEPEGIAMDASGNLYIADTGNDLIREITPAGKVTTIAGDVPGAGTLHKNFHQPLGIVLNNAGNAYVSEFGGNVISQIILTGYSIDKALPPGLAFDPQTGTIGGTPTAPSPATDYTVTAYNAGGSNSTIVNITVIDNTPIPQTITFAPLPVKTYGDPDFSADATSSNNTIPVTYASDNTGVATIVNGQIHIVSVGTTNITAAQAGNDSYSAAAPVTEILTVNKAPLTLTADNKSKTVGQANPIFTFSHTPFAYNEDVSVLTTQPVLSTIATTNSTVGQYVITIDGAKSPNYDIQHIPGTLTISAAPQSIVVPNAFSPNGDGINDLWNIKSLTDFPQCVVSVYSRNGSLVFQSRGYVKPWDGTYNGSPVPTGTYYYIIDPKSGLQQLSGYVAVLR
ncbi:MAG: gliding motility-associated C-terminal domain-containing protein [Sphingobacteriales bacterium]